MVWRSGDGGRGRGEDNERYETDAAGEVDSWESDDDGAGKYRGISHLAGRDAVGRVGKSWWRVPLLLINAVGLLLLCLGALHIDLGVSAVFLLLLVVNADYVWAQVVRAARDLGWV